MAKKFREPGEERRWKAAGKLDAAGSGAALEKGTEEGEREEILGAHDRPDIRAYPRKSLRDMVTRGD